MAAGMLRGDGTDRLRVSGIADLPNLRQTSLGSRVLTVADLSEKCAESYGPHKRFFFINPQNI